MLICFYWVWKVKKTFFWSQAWKGHGSTYETAWCFIISPVFSWSSYCRMCLFFFSSWNVKFLEIKDLLDQVAMISPWWLAISPMACNIGALLLNFSQITCALKLENWRIIWLMCTQTLWMNQFAPLDIPASVDTFLGHWKPNAIMLMESELWPNLIIGASKNGVSCSFSRNLTFCPVHAFGNDKWVNFPCNCTSIRSYSRVFIEWWPNEFLNLL